MIAGRGLYARFLASLVLAVLAVLAVTIVGLERLTGPGGMGTLFKVMALTGPGGPLPAGFGP